MQLELNYEGQSALMCPFKMVHQSKYSHISLII